MRAPASESVVEPPGTAAASTVGPTIVDVLILYTTAARTGAGGVPQINNTIALSLGTANQSLVDSFVDMQLRLVHTAEATYTEAGNQTDLARLRAVGDGYLDDAHTLRAAYGADLVALVAEAGYFACGTAYLMTQVTPTFRDRAFSVVSRQCIINGYSMQHEMGHNLGCEHDMANAIGPGAFPYSFGYRTPDNRYRTIMAYTPGTRLNVWSSPNVLRYGYVMGTANEDNARSLGGTKDTARLFTSTKVLEWTRQEGGITGQNGEPRLDGAGLITNLVPITVTVSSMRTGAPGVLAIGFPNAGVPLLGGLLLVDPLITVPLVGTAAPIAFDASVLATVASGVEVRFQAWFVDAAGPQGIAASDGLGTIVP